MKNMRSGFVLIVALIIITVAIVLTTYMFNQGITHRLFARTVVDREKAQRLALGGVQVALSQLALKATDTSLAQEPEKLLNAILPVINRWQYFEFKQEIEGVDGKLMLCIMCEEGKIDLNRIFDFTNKSFVGEGQKRGDIKKIMPLFFAKLRLLVGDHDLFTDVERFLKARSRKITDVTELLNIKEFAVFKDKIFYEPPQTEEKGERPVYLLDLFTVHSGKAVLEPWLLSDSLCAILGLRRAQAGELKKRSEARTAWLKDFKPQAKWTADWDQRLKPVYDRDFSTLPGGIEAFLSPQFEPRTFSVLSYGTVGTVTQRLYAIVERQPTSEKRSSSQFITKKIYWI